MKDERYILNEIERIKFNLRMNERKTYSEYLAYERDSKKLEELKSELEYARRKL